MASFYAARYKWCLKLDSYWEGIDAGMSGVPIENNPYARDSRNWLAWRAGWWGIV